MQTALKTLALSTLAITASSQAIASSTAEASAKKNVLLIMVDDLKPTIGTYGDSAAITPGIDQLANEGVRFDMAYANQAVCMPSRYNLLLGSRSTSTGLYNFGSEFRDIYLDAETLPQHFMEAGYRTESIGKVFHVGHGNSDDAASWSLPPYKDKVIDYILPESTGGKMTREEGLFTNLDGELLTAIENSKLPKGTPWYYNRELGMKIFSLPRGAAWESADVLDEAYADGRVAKQAIYRLRNAAKNPDQPFFMAVGFARPHLPFSAPKKYWDMYDPAQLPMPEFTEAPEGAPEYAVKRGGEILAFKDIPAKSNGLLNDELSRKLIHGYYASVSYMDAQVGKVLKELKKTGLDKNTVVVLWGDNGFHLGDHGSWTKHSNYEEAANIPLIISAPGVAAGSTEQLTETVDLYPTLSELAGIAKPDAAQPIDGISLVPVLKDTDTRIRDHAYHAWLQVDKLGQAIRTDRYRFVKWTAADGKTVGTELYDYENDPLEKVNVADQNPAIIAEMTRILATHPEPKRRPMR
ncbi:iduronate-2-sulfatase [Endozoicomonas sp. OPT23]|nr:iduronate-2-sulfatase [Endozoicomonas sp. OPT23]